MQKMDRSGGERFFAAPWGRLLKGTSIGATLLLLGVAGLLFYGNVAPLMAVLLLLMPGICALFIVRGYTVGLSEIRVHRPCWDTRIALRQIHSISQEPEAMKRSIRVAGNGGLYSFTGYYWSRKLGLFHAYVNDLARCVVVRTAERTCVFSPDHPGAFVSLLNERGQALGWSNVEQRVP